jgi:hypothetical protein
MPPRPIALNFPQAADGRKSLGGSEATALQDQPKAISPPMRFDPRRSGPDRDTRTEHRPECSASTNGISSRTIKIAIGITAYPNPGSCGRCVEACSHAFARCSAESREGVGYAEDAVFDLRDRLDATRLRDCHFHLGISIRSAQYAERCDEEDGDSHALGLSP